MPREDGRRDATPKVTTAQVEAVLRQPWTGPRGAVTTVSEELECFDVLDRWLGQTHRRLDWIDHLSVYRVVARGDGCMTRRLLATDDRAAGAMLQVLERLHAHDAWPTRFRSLRSSTNVTPKIAGAAYTQLRARIVDTAAQLEAVSSPRREPMPVPAGPWKPRPAGYIPPIRNGDRAGLRGRSHRPGRAYGGWTQ